MYVLIASIVFIMFCSIMFFTVPGYQDFESN